MDGLNGVDGYLASIIEQAAQIIERDFPQVSLVVTSGYRSPAHQAYLRAQWDKGIRAGLVVRPAERSAHSDGRAVDVQFTIGGVPIPVRATPLAAFRWLADLLRPAGVLWGGTFRQRDPNHFEIPLRA